MKKKLVISLLLVACCFGSAGLFAAENTMPKEVYVNLDSVWRSSAQGKEDLTKIDATVKESQEKVNLLKSELEKQAEEFKAAKTEEEKKELAVKIEQKRRELIETTTLKNRAIEQMKNEAQQTFVETIIPIINKYRTDNDIMIIRRYTANDVVSLDPKIDITEEILTIYNK